MLCLYLQTLSTAKNAAVPFRLSVMSSENMEVWHFGFRPDVVLTKKTYETYQLDRMTVLSAPPFCDHADELIDLFQNRALVFSDAKQFQLLKSQFRNIGYNFNIKPKYLFFGTEKDKQNPIASFLDKSNYYPLQSWDYANSYLQLMVHYIHNTSDIPETFAPKSELSQNLEISSYKTAPGVYYFLNASNTVIYVGKAKNIRKRLQSHFSQNSSSRTLDYSKVKSITVEYSGNDILAQLIESANIKALQPVFNTQQVADPAPYIINHGQTAKGIHKLQITRKDITDNMPEKYFNRLSVKKALETFCTDYNLCRKHCGLEKVKGPCSKVTLQHQPCVCAGTEVMADYNKRFEIAFYNFKNRKDRNIYKLKGRHKNEDAFIYMVNGIYEGYGFIDKNESIATINDILGHLIPQTNNYDTSRILSALDKIISADQILHLDRF